MNGEGIIKYNCTWIKGDSLDSKWINELNTPTFIQQNEP